MHVYKFRLLSDVNDDFVRDIEIQANQTFLDFHNAINQCVKLKGQELASFHICDQKWNKFQEITLIDMIGLEEPEEEKKVVEETYIMKDAVIRDFINEPHQRLLYEYDFLNLSTFFIELLSVHKQKDESSYPRCTLSKGDMEQLAVPQPIMEEDEELDGQLLSEMDDLLDDTIDFKEDLERFDETDFKLN
jgi:hypothetical protein